jgi:hypothetical protein
MKRPLKDIVVSKEILGLFKNSVRIIDRKHLAGMWPVDARQLIKLKDMLPQLFLDENIMKKYDLAIGYNGKTVKKDLPKLGVELVEDRIINDIFIHGIPVPWHLLRKAGIDYKKFDIVLTPKQL